MENNIHFWYSNLELAELLETVSWILNTRFYTCFKMYMCNLDLEYYRKCQRSTSKDFEIDVLFYKK